MPFQNSHVVFFRCDSWEKNAAQRDFHICRWVFPQGVKSHVSAVGASWAVAAPGPTCRLGWLSEDGHMPWGQLPCQGEQVTAEELPMGKAVEAGEGVRFIWGSSRTWVGGRGYPQVSGGGSRNITCPLVAPWYHRSPGQLAGLGDDPTTDSLGGFKKKLAAWRVYSWNLELWV